jgi:hypothetical protein
MKLEPIGIQRTGRVSVSWVASTRKTDSVIRWALLCPPNDKIKRRKLQKWIEKNQEKVDDIISELEEEGYQID